MSTRDTVFALATAPGKSGIAIIRLSGPQAEPALVRLTRQRFTPNMAQTVVFRHPCTKEILDRGIGLFFKGPLSFTGEDVAELHLHGSLAVIRELLAVLSEMEGLRPAEPGEFSRRAFLNGKMDLIEAEGLNDLIAAETSRQKTQAIRQMQGELSQQYHGLREGIIRCLAHLEAYIDFPDEEIPAGVLQEVSSGVERLKTTIAASLQDHRRGEQLREGCHVVILGAPNCGKSSLLNALARKEAAIVSHQAGTTRDVIEVHMELAGFPVILTDTAGIRESGDAIEEEGIRRALARAGVADLKLVLFDASVSDPDKHSLSLIDDKTIVILNKSDIQISDNLINIINKLNLKNNYLLVSARTGQQIDILLAKIEENISALFSSETAPLITRARHRALLNEALEALQRFSPKAPLELSCEELRHSAQALGKITGKIQIDDILDVVFSQFCIGK